MNKYTVRIEIEVNTIDLATYIVEANSVDEAKELAVDQFNNGAEPIDRWQSDSVESTIDMNYYADWEVTKHE